MAFAAMAVRLREGTAGYYEISVRYAAVMRPRFREIRRLAAAAIAPTLVANPPSDRVAE